MVDESPAAERVPLWEQVYSELRMIARARVRHQVEPAMPGTTSLVHQVFLKGRDVDGGRWPSTAHFLRYASVAMRNLLVDEARALRRLKRNPTPGAAQGAAAEPDCSGDVLDIHRALDQLAESDPRSAAIVECRFFGGLTVEETAEALSLSPATVKRGWDLARVWLYRNLRCKA